MTIFVFDCGASHVRMAIGQRRKILVERVVDSPKTWPAAMKIFQKFAKDYEHFGRIDRVVGGVPGVLDPRHTTLLVSPGLPRWERQPIQKDLAKMFSAPVTLENDASLGALGEAVLGAGRKYSIIGYLAVGTGVGGARVTHGRLEPVHYGYEPGHHRLSSELTLSELVGGSFVQKKYGKTWKRFTSKIWKHISDSLADGIVNAIDFWSPDIIILGGSVVLKGKISFSYLRTRVAKRLLVVPKPPRLCRAQLGDRAGLYGALVRAATK